MCKPYQPPRFRVGTILRKHRERIENCTTFTTHQKRMLRALADCRTAALGAHQVACTACGQVQIAYNSCRNRNCPNCQQRQRQQWVQARAEELLPVPYFHLVFTLPDVLNPLCLHYPKVLYQLLFEAVWYTVNKLGHDPKWLGAQVGMVAILHTWGSNLSLHPHLHCMVPAGGLDAKGKWKHSKAKGKYLFNRGVMGQVFRARYVKLLRKAIQNGQIDEEEVPPDLFRKLFAKEWITYAQKPFRQPQHVINYIGRYSHSIAISNHRIENLADGKVTFSCKNYRKGGEQQSLSLDEWEFIQRFARHIIPHRFVRIRHYGILSNRSKQAALQAARKALGADQPKKSEKQQSVLPPDRLLCYCSGCGRSTPHLILGVLPPARAGPKTAVTDSSKCQSE